MGNTEPESTQKVDSPTFRVHRRQRFWQILLPVLLAAALVAACGIWLALGAPGAPGGTVNNQTLSQALTILVLLPVMAAAIILFVILGGMIFGFSRLYQVLPGVSAQVLAFFQRVSAYTKAGSDKVAGPVIALRANVNKFNKFFASLDQRIQNKGQQQ